MLERVAGQLRYGAQPMDVLWQHMAASGTLGSFALVRDTVKGLDSHPFAVAFQRAVTKATSAGWLTAESARLLHEFGESSGRFDMAGQLTHLAGCQQRLQTATEEAKQVAVAKGQIYQMLGLAGGVGVALLFI